jgi:hypothetical protein
VRFVRTWLSRGAGFSQVDANHARLREVRSLC